MSAVITLADAIAGLVAEKRAVGYKYVSEERALARFRRVLRQRVSRSGDGHASVGAGVDRRGQRAGGEARDRAESGRAGQGARPLACAAAAWTRTCCRAGVLAQARPLRPAHLHRPGARGAVRGDRPLPLLPGGAVPASGDAGPVPHDLRVRAALLGSPAAARRAMSTSRTACCRSGMRKAARTGSCPSQSRCANGSPATTPSSPDSRAGSGSSPAPRWTCR